MNTAHRKAALVIAKNMAGVALGWTLIQNLCAPGNYTELVQFVLAVAANILGLAQRTPYHPSRCPLLEDKLSIDLRERN